MTKPTPRVARLSEATFTPRFEYGDQAQVAQVCGGDDGTKLGTGFVRMKNAEIPWTIKYDEVVYVIEGEFTVKMDSGDLTAGPGDCIWLPAHTELVYKAKEALLFYAIQPADWATDG